MNSTKLFWYASRPANEISLEWDKTAGRRMAKAVCPVNSAHRATGKRLGDLHLILPQMIPKDFMWTWYSDCLVQEIVGSKLVSAGFSGFNTRPVNIRNASESDSPLRGFGNLK
jgi:hypothetical protein